MPHKKRFRATKADVEARRAAIYDIVADGEPMSVRQVFYQATVHGLVEKAESGYVKVQHDLTIMRESGLMPYSWLADSTRWRTKPETFGSPGEAIEDMQRYYRKDLWRSADAYVEIWIEKEALKGVIFPVTNKYDVSLMATRGYASLSFLHTSAEEISEKEVPTFIYMLGDYDPSGVNAHEHLEEKLREFAPYSEIHFERLGVTAEQIDAYDLPTRPTKKSDTRSKGFGDISVELDAFEFHTLRGMVQDAIERHLPQEQYAVLKIAEESEREYLKAFAIKPYKPKKRKPN